MLHFACAGRLLLAVAAILSLSCAAPGPSLESPVPAVAAATPTASPMSTDNFLATQATSAHPRLFFSTQDIPRLRAQAASTHQEIWQPILAFAQSSLGSVPGPMPAEGDLESFRNAGNQLIAFAFAYLITGDRAYLDLTRRHLLAPVGWQYWGDDTGYGDRGLGFHHLLLGSAIAYDWVYNDLSPADRTAIGSNLARRAQESFEATNSAKSQWNNWWRQAYIQNFSWTNYSALGVAALVLDGEDPRAPEWLDRATTMISRDMVIVGGISDGSWHEGMPYQDYATTMAMPFIYNLKALKGVQVLPPAFLRAYGYARVYNSLPGADRYAMPYGDVDWRWANSYGPEGILRLAARESRDGHFEWMARQSITNVGRDSNIYSAPWYVFEFLYYDPTVTPVGPEDLPLSRTFSDLEGVIWRTGWSSNDLTFALKTGAPGGRFAFDAFTQGKRPPFDPNSADDQFSAGHDHDDANTFYLYRGGVDLASERAAYDDSATSFHNTLLVDGRGQYRAPPTYGGHEYWDTDPSVFRGTDGRLEKVGEAGDLSYLVADATNRYRYPDPESGKPADLMVNEFRRYVIFAKPNYLVMVDNVRSDTPHRYDWVSHFGSDVSMEGDWIKGIGANVQIPGAKDQVVGVKLLAPQDYAWGTGNDGKPYIRVRPLSPVGSTRFVTMLYPTDEEGWALRPEVSLFGDGDDATGVRVRMNGIQDHLIKHSKSDSVALGEYSFDGITGTVGRDDAGGLQRVFLGGGSTLSDRNGDRVLIQVPRAVTAIEVFYRGNALEVDGDGLSGARIYAPGVDPGRVTLNGQPAQASRSDDYLVLP